jgi:tetratricopeptide (TPR) repeat protein
MSCDRRILGKGEHVDARGPPTPRYTGDISLTKSEKSVATWEERVTISTYPEQLPDKNPMFFEKRVYQGSSGKVYPSPITDHVSNEKSERAYKAVFLENEYLHLMILPEIGGRIHIGQDKTNGYDFFYRQNVIKPALVGLLGPWISGGVEFNWPQHHRPSTYMPVQHTIESSADGSTTIWLSEHEPMQRMKGMVGVCLHPGKSYIEAKVRLYNRSPFVQTFLWWTNVGIRVHEHYQAFFPPDVTYVADHAKRAISSFPIARNFYYGVDYRRGVDISWYKNIPVPTSYMVTESKYDFFGGYDHQKNAGVVHFANHHIAPGKKLWTWGNAEFGYVWDRNLTDSDGPYIELMAGAFTDNQPDFSWLHPYETRTWSQFWYPIQEIGPAKNANRMAAVNLEQADGKLKVGVWVTEPFEQARLLVTGAGKPVLEDVCNLEPGRAYVREVRAKGDLTFRLLTSEGREIIQYTPPEVRHAATLPAPATEPLPPKDVPSNDELYITGLHLEQYRHATRYPEPYWEEALRRDPLDGRCNTAMGLLELRRGQFPDAEMHFRRAIQRQTRRNPNPADGDAYYYLGLTLQYQERLEEAYASYYKATWNHAWQAAAYYHLAEIDCRCLEFDRALGHLEQSLTTDVNNLKARNLRTAILRRRGALSEAADHARGTQKLDPLDVWSRHELALLSGNNVDETDKPKLPSEKPADAQLQLDLAFDYAAAGFWAEARDLLSRYAHKSGRQPYPMVLYLLGYCSEKLGDHGKATSFWTDASKASPDYCFPSRVEEMLVLQSALAANPSDARGHYYLGNLLYDKKRYEEASREWERSVDLEPSFAIPWRNLGIAYFNVRKDPDKAVAAYEHAVDANSTDARLLYESDQLLKRTGTSAAERLCRLQGSRDLVSQRDDLTVEFITLLNQTGCPEQALGILTSRRFNPWEGGEGLVSGQYVWAHVLIGRSLLEVGEWPQALEHFSKAREYPRNLGEGKHLLTRETHLDYFAGLALSNMGRHGEAREYWARTASNEGPITWLSYYQARSLEAIGRQAEADRLLSDILAFAQKQMAIDAKIDYFATSLPNLLLFEDDLQKRNRAECLLLLALSELGMRNTERAVEWLREVLSLDCNHMVAQQELDALTRGSTAATVRP